MNPYFNYKGAELRGTGGGAEGSAVLWRLRAPPHSGSFPFCPLPGVGLGQVREWACWKLPCFRRWG